MVQLLNPVRLDYQHSAFATELARLLAWESVSDENIQPKVKEIIDQVRLRGDEALVEYTCRFDRRQVDITAQLILERDRLEQALDRMPATSSA